MEHGGFSRIFQIPCPAHKQDLTKLPLFLVNRMPTSFKRALIFALMLIGTPAFAQDFIPHTETHLRDPNELPREHPVDMQNMRIEASFETTKGLVKGRVTHSFI